MKITNSLDWYKSVDEIKSLVSKTDSNYSMDVTLKTLRPMITELSKMEVEGRRRRKMPLNYVPLLEKINQELEDIQMDMFVFSLSK